MLPLHHVSGLMAWMRCALTGCEYRPLDWKKIEAGELPAAIPASAPVMKKDESGVLIKAVAVQSKPGDPSAPTVTKTAFQRPSGSVTKPDADKKTASVQALKKAESKAKPLKTELTAIAKR